MLDNYPNRSRLAGRTKITLSKVQLPQKATCLSKGISIPKPNGSFLQLREIYWTPTHRVQRNVLSTGNTHKNKVPDLTDLALFGQNLSTVYRYYTQHSVMINLLKLKTGLNSKPKQEYHQNIKGDCFTKQVKKGPCEEVSCESWLAGRDWLLVSQPLSQAEHSHLWLVQLH